MFSPFQPSSFNVFNAESGFLYRCLCHNRAFQSKYVRPIVALFILFQSLSSSYFTYFSSLLHTSLTFPPFFILLLLFLPPSYLSFPSSVLLFLLLQLIALYIMTTCIKDIIYSAAQVRLLGQSLSSSYCSYFSLLISLFLAAQVCLLGQPPPRVQLLRNWGAKV